MNNPTQLLPTSLIEVEVPKDARDYQTKWIGEKLYLLYYYNSHAVNKVELGQDDFEILGEITADEITFDVEPYVEKTKHYSWGGYGYAKTEDVFINYTDIGLSIERTAKESFYSLLQSNGLLFSNPMGEDNFTDSDGYVLDDIAHKEWQEAESKVIKGKLVILKPV